MDDTISRKAAIAATWFEPSYTDPLNVLTEVRDRIKDLPSAEPERKKGEWILVKGSNGKDYHKCSECLHTQDITGVKNYCAVCGAQMGAEGEE